MPYTLPSIVIFHMGRCGSTVLSGLLKRQTGWTADSEIFEQRPKQADLAPDALAPLPFMALKRSRALDRSHGYSCELKYLPGTHLDKIDMGKSEAVTAFSELGFDHFILLHRENLLDRLISQLVAIARKAYVRRPGEEISLDQIHIPIQKMRVGPNVYSLQEALQMLADQTDLMRAALQASGRPLLELTYEEHIRDNPNSAVSLVAEFAGIAALPFEPDISRIVTRSKSELIENYDAVAQHLQDSPFETFLDH